MPFTDFADKSWQPEVLTPGKIPAELREALLDRGSLTQRLKRQHNNNFFVQVLLHQQAMPSFSEQCFLGVPEYHPASIREVLLYGSGVPVVFARSVLPESSLIGKNKELLNLGSKPLGEYIFNQPKLTRGPIEIACIPARQFNQHLNFDYRDEPAWGRRSLFFLNDKPISVCEVFLPDIAMKKAQAI